MVMAVLTVAFSVAFPLALQEALVSPAAADPLAARPARPDLETVRKQVEQLNEQAAEVTEQYNAARVRLGSVQVALKASSSRVVQQQQRVTQARKSLGRLAAESYRSGGMDGLMVLLDDDPQALLAASGLRASLSERQAQGVQALLAEQKQLAKDQGDLKTQQSQLTTTQNEIETKKKDVEAKLAKAKQLLAGLDGSQRRAIARISRNMDGQSLAALGIDVPADGKLTCAGVGIQAPNARAAKAIAFACAQLGKPYGWGGEGPRSYDCSGLVLASWGAAGVSLPHNAAMQSSYGTRVSMAALQPGDVVFFRSPISHNGIYIGKGLMIHAPQTGDVIRIASARLDNRLTAAVRL